MKKIRPLGRVTEELEHLLLEMTENHELQMGEILNLIRGYLEIHCPNCVEVYEEDNSKPLFFYGHKDCK